ncbi:hypothetical protein [Pseudonocardia sp. TRM90224]|uniref:hypothetical protein n=1 Tax=Pseudonocardia sp. TRM90224 TaxID=2812678 RepID=UPI001E39A24B|nr:hypothetical protein [Pseudonocardia sp. TRM90224]
MTARFVLSFDCEGKWGVADHLTEGVHASLSDARLRAAYTNLVALLDEFAIPATFAFVGTFSLDPAGLRDLLPALHDINREVPGYLGDALDDCVRTGAQGWTGDWAMAMVDAARTEHEIALHGATHIPWDWPGLTADAARRELGMLYAANVPLVSRASTYIYPRNAVAHTDVLDEFGLAGARAARLRSSRLASLAAEFNLNTAPDPDPAPARPLVIPAGHFVNWRSGARRIVPPAVSALRAARMLRRAAGTGEVVHYWTHPENIASAPGTLDVLRGILAEVARLRDEGRCDVQTQEQYCRIAQPDHVALCDERRARQVP